MSIIICDEIVVVILEPGHAKMCLMLYASNKGEVQHLCCLLPRYIWFDFCFTALQHILGHFGRGQLP